MVDFRNRKRFETREPVLKVDPGLALGSYVFQLTVVDNAGTRSKPIRMKIEVVRSARISDPRLVTPINPVLREPVAPISTEPVIGPRDLNP